MRSRRPWGLRIATLSPLSWDVWGGVSVVRPYPDLNETSPSLGAANCEIVPSWAPGRSCGLVPYADQNDTSESTGSCERRNCRNFRGLLGSPAEWCPTGIRMRPRRPQGSANCEAVATFVGSWGIQRSAVLRGSRWDLAVPGGCEVRNRCRLRGFLGGPA